MLAQLTIENSIEEGFEVAFAEAVKIEDDELSEIDSIATTVN
jgi:hypothetical protein